MNKKYYSDIAYDSWSWFWTLLWVAAFVICICIWPASFWWWFWVWLIFIIFFGSLMFWPSSVYIDDDYVHVHHRARKRRYALNEIKSAELAPYKRGKNAYITITMKDGAKYDVPCSDPEPILGGISRSVAGQK